MERATEPGRAIVSRADATDWRYVPAMCPPPPVRVTVGLSTLTIRQIRRVTDVRDFWRFTCFLESRGTSFARIRAFFEHGSGSPLKSERAPGTVVSFVPAHGESRAGVVAKQLSRTLTEGLGGAVLLASFDSRGYSLMERDARLRGVWTATPGGAFVNEEEGLETLDARETSARQARAAYWIMLARKYQVVCADLTGARPAHALEVLRASDAIFLVTDSDRPSIEGVLEKTEWLRSIDLMERVGLLLRRSPGGLNADEVEEVTGLPVCCLVESEQHIQLLAQWLGNSNQGAAEAGFAMAG